MGDYIPKAMLIRQQERAAQWKAEADRLERARQQLVTDSEALREDLETLKESQGEHWSERELRIRSLEGECGMLRKKLAEKQAAYADLIADHHQLALDCDLWKERAKVRVESAGRYAATIDRLRDVLRDLVDHLPACSTIRERVIDELEAIQ